MSYTTLIFGKKNPVIIKRMSTICLHSRCHIPPTPSPSPNPSNFFRKRQGGEAVICLWWCYIMIHKGAHLQPIATKPPHMQMLHLPSHPASTGVKKSLLPRRIAGNLTSEEDGIQQAILWMTHHPYTTSHPLTPVTRVQIYPHTVPGNTGRISKAHNYIFHGVLSSWLN